MKKLCLVVILLFSLSVVYADSGSIKLLAISETGGNYTGSLADLYLAISSGIGRVYIESYPLSKLDTQFSTRLARDVACEFSDVDCSKYDFFYTIKAGSSIVGGPSAGAAATVLTVSLLNNMEIDNQTAITGTINSGGIIGPVGGIKEKIDAAHLSGVKKMLVPYGSDEELIEYGKNKSVEVIEVSDLDEALFYFTGESRTYAQNISIDPSYNEIMKEIATIMCNNTMAMLEKTLNYVYEEGEIIPDELLELELGASDLYTRGQLFFDDGKYYSAASQCFGANVRYREFEYELKNVDKEGILKIANSLSVYLSELDEEISKGGIRYLSDLEAYMIIKERIVDAERNINEAIEDESLTALSYAVERSNSAFMWSKFFGLKDKKIRLDKEKLKTSCQEKLTEVSELYRYGNILLPNVFENARNDIETVDGYFKNGDYELCLFKASKTKADINVILSGAGTQEEQIDALLRGKINAAKKVIIRENEKGIFPILGYSYYEYAGSLEESDKFLSLVYAEYGLELSNLDIYFKGDSFKLPKISINFDQFDQKAIIFLILGVLVGAGVTVLLYKKRRKFKGAIKLK